MKKISPGTVLGFLALFVALGGSAFAAKTLIDGHSIKRNSIPMNRLSKSLQTKINTNSARLRAGGTTGPRGPQGAQGPKGDRGEKGDKGDKGDRGPGFVASNWGVMDRNTIGSPVAQTRQGPGTPPFGRGSLNFLVGSGNEKLAYGNEVDFVGRPLSGINAVAFEVFQTGEDQTDNGGPNNLPNIDFEIDPSGAASTAPNFSTMVYVPAGPASNINNWSHFDATTNGQWYFTGAFGTSSGCNQTTMCSFAQAKAAAPDATLLSVAVVKGRDDAWQGAIDGLRINNTRYDFEQEGVIATPVS